MENVTILFKNGMSIVAEKNATSFITDAKPQFPSDLSRVEVVGLWDTWVFENAEVIECASVDSRYWFTFREVPEQERIQKQMQANIEYIAMMADVDLEV